jgi:tetratricopeptide (TPR) repeat protein
VTQDDSHLTAALNEYQVLLDAGQRPDRQAFRASHPKAGPLLDECLDGLECMHRAAADLNASTLDAEGAPPEDPARPLTARSSGDDRLAPETGGARGIGFERVAQWLQRHKTLLLVAATGLVVALVVSLVWVGRSYRRLEAAYRAKLAQRQSARQAVDDLYAQVAEQWLADEPEMDEGQCSFLLKALHYYEEAAQEYGADSNARFAQALASRRVGDLEHRLGNHPAATPAFAQAVALLADLVREHPGDPIYRLESARCQAARAAVLDQTGRYEEAEPVQREAVLLAEQLVSEAPTEPRYRMALAIWSQDLGSTLTHRDRNEEAEAYFRRALHLAEDLVRDDPSNPIYRNRLAGIYRHWGDLARRMGRPSQAEDLYGKALQTLEKLMKDQPRKSTYRADWAGLALQLGELCQQRGDPRAAEQYLVPCERVYRDLAGSFPKTANYREGQAVVRLRLGHLYTATDRAGEARLAFQDASELFEELIRECPNRVGNRRLYGSLLGDCPRAQLRKPLRALELLQQERVLDPGNPNLLIEIGVANYRVGRWPAAAAELEKGLAQTDSSRGRLFLAMSFARLGQREQARRCYEQAVRQMNKGQPGAGELGRCRAEAAELLGVR